MWDTTAPASILAADAYHTRSSIALVAAWLPLSLGIDQILREPGSVRFYAPSFQWGVRKTAADDGHSNFF